MVIGRSNIVGTPVSILLAKNLETAKCTVTLCHSRTRDLAAIARQADIIVAAIGRPEFVTADMVKPGAVVIDVGTTRVTDANKKSGFSLKGDVNFAEVSPIASRITPRARRRGAHDHRHAAAQYPARRQGRGVPESSAGGKCGLTEVLARQPLFCYSYLALKKCRAL